MSGVSEFDKILDQKIKEAIPIMTFWAKVISVDWEKKTMKAKGISDDLMIEDVNLGLGSLTRKPAEGSKVLVGIEEKQSANAYLVDAKEVEEFEWQTAQCTYKINDEGFLIKKDDDSMKEIMNDLLTEINALNDEVQKIVVSIGTTPNVPQLQTISQNVDQINNRLTEVLQ